MTKIKSATLVSVAAIILSLATVLIALGLPKPTPDSKYRVFCANEKIEVEQRTLEQQKNARGSSVCVLGEFDYLSDAEKFAEQQGGKGASCKCP